MKFPNLKGFAEVRWMILYIYIYLYLYIYIFFVIVFTHLACGEVIFQTTYNGASET